MTGDLGGVPDARPHRLDELAVGWALHALEPEDEAVFAVHLPGCARCAATVAETTELMGAMARDLPAAEPSEDAPLPPAGGRRDDGAGAAARPPRRQPVHVGPGRRDPGAGAGHRPLGTGDRPAWRRLLPAALVAAAVAAIVGLGLWNVFLAAVRGAPPGDRGVAGGGRGGPAQPGQATIAPAARPTAARSRPSWRATTSCRSSPPGCRSTTPTPPATWCGAWATGRRSPRAPSTWPGHRWTCEP